MNWHCRSLVVTCPKIVDMMLPEPVSAITVNVVGPSGLMSNAAAGWRCRTFRGQVHPRDVQRQPLHVGGPRRADGREHVGGLAGSGTGQRDLGGPRHRQRGRDGIAAVRHTIGADRGYMKSCGRSVGAEARGRRRSGRWRRCRRGRRRSGGARRRWRRWRPRYRKPVGLRQVLVPARKPAARRPAA